MLYIDQPFGVGFSNEFNFSSNSECDSLGICQGSSSSSAVNSTVSAAAKVWQLLQVFYSEFPQYENREFGVFTESYGGHYGPGTRHSSIWSIPSLTSAEFAHYFETQNAAIASGSITAQNISLVALGINNGWYDSTIQEKAYIEFGYNNTWKQLIDESQYTSLMDSFTTECLPGLQNCTSLGVAENFGSDETCSIADNDCYSAVDTAIYSAGDFDPYDVREPSDDPYPPQNYVDYLARADVRTAIGAVGTYTDCSSGVGNAFSNTGDRKLIRLVFCKSSYLSFNQMLDLSSPLYRMSSSPAFRPSSGPVTQILSATGSEVSSL
jgi:carboxypeptidase C (cathepsin A)